MSHITPEEQIERLVLSAVTKENRDRLSVISGQGLIPQIAESAFRVALQDLKREVQPFPSLFDLVSDHLIHPCKELFMINYWHLALGRFDALPPSVPALPSYITALMRSPCHIFSTQNNILTVGQTHSLYLVPAGTLREWAERINAYGKEFFKRDDHPLQFRQFWKDAYDATIDVPVDEPQWILMTNDVVPGTRNQTYEEQVAIIESKGPYQVPTLRATIFLTFFNLIASERRLFTTAKTPKDNHTYTHVEGKVSGKRVIVGGLKDGGLTINQSVNKRYQNVGMAAMRILKF